MILKLTLLLLSFAHLTIATYNPADGLEYAYASSLASCSAANIMAWNCGYPCDNLQGYQPFASEFFTPSPNETLAYSMIYSPSAQKFITTFRGTVGEYELHLESVYSNAIPYNLSDVPGALVLDYFFTRYLDDFRPSVLAHLERAYAAYPDFDYIFTGHSLGAALSTISAFDIAANGPVPSQNIVIYNYGSPRVGNQAYADAVQNAISEIYRVTHWTDIVPHLPPCLLGSNGECTPTAKTNSTLPLMWPVWHVAQEIFYNQNNTDYVECVGGEDPNCADQFPLNVTTWLEHQDYVGVQMGCV